MYYLFQRNIYGPMAGFFDPNFLSYTILSFRARFSVHSVQNFILLHDSWEKYLTNIWMFWFVENFRVKNELALRKTWKTSGQWVGHIGVLISPVAVLEISGRNWSFEESIHVLKSKTRKKLLSNKADFIY